MGKLRFAIFGYGRMGHVTEQVLKERGETIVSIVGHQEYREGPIDKLLRDVDSVICFVSPESGYEVTTEVLGEGVDIVVGTTKFYLMPDQRTLNQEMLKEFAELARETESRMVYASNFAPGVNAYWEGIRMVGRLFSRLDYDPGIVEIHHDRKEDVSGTAKTAGNILLEVYPNKTTLNFGECRRKRRPEEIVIASIRVGDVPGTHKVIFDKSTDTIEFTHIVRDRKIFARGAVESAYWLREQSPGLYEIRDRFLK